MNRRYQASSKMTSGRLNTTTPISAWKWGNWLAQSSMTGFASRFIVNIQLSEWTRSVSENFVVVDFVVEKVGKVFFYSFELTLWEKRIAICLIVTLSAYLACQFHIEKYLNFLVSLLLIQFLQLLQRLRTAVIVKVNLTHGRWPSLILVFNNLFCFVLSLFFCFSFSFVSILFFDWI